ncbi:MAG: type IV secretion system DNA-binding domain-containing protein [Sphingomonas sp.]
MFLGAAKIPFLIWLAVVVVVYWIIMASVMGEHEIQLVSWRVGSALWTWMDFSPLKPMNIVLADDSVRRVSIGYIPYVPDVQIATTKALNALAGSLFGGTLIALPASAWFIGYANRQGGKILDERHERGALLVDRNILLADVLAHNMREFQKKAAVLFPGLKPKAVLALPFADRKAAGLHHPYTLGGVPYPYGLEQSHTVIIGTTGSGKTTQMKSMVAEMRARGDSAVIFDLTGSFIESFYNPKTDWILNPGDARCPCWSVFEDCTTEAEFTAAAQALIPHDGGGSDPFWIVSARLLFVQMCLKLQEFGLTTNQALADNLIKTDLKRLHKILLDTSASPLTSPDAAKMAESIRSVYVANANALSAIPQDGEIFSIREWVLAKNKPGSILFVSARYVDLPLYKTLLTLFLDIAVNTLMTLPRTQSLRTWYMFDELGALHRLPAIENGLQTARGFGGAMVLGLHSFARLQAVYGREGAENMASLTGSKLILKTGDRKTAETCAEFIGHREVRQMDEAYSYGNNPLRDGATITPKKEIAPLVIPDDITNLPSLHGFVKFPDGFPAARVELQWTAYPDAARGFEPRTPPPVGPRDAGNPLGQLPKPKPGGGDGGGPEEAATTPGHERDTTVDGSVRDAFVRRELSAKAAQALAKLSDPEPERADLERQAQVPAEIPADQAIEDDRLVNVDVQRHARDRGSKPGSVERRVIENVEERQAAMQRALDSEFSLSAEPENDIEID